ncbi:hypothetical protein NPS70_18090 [Streptomyces sp. C10-9-1]|uniref:hypothetical protein n=1 Tax=Streptomyces sp. C10-9-1 TaxID=1859285 RepID=UPI0021127618|nr:hypothetical protein [Streptomyces sp. C10-9-1]MCQ6555086.1 hypothetical protein [Streptomyces sp. C10-9-1]
MIPEPPRPPAPTRAEGACLGSRLQAADRLGRANPARGDRTCVALRSAQALAESAIALRDALTRMHRNGESDVHSATLARALRALDGERRTNRPTLPPLSGPEGI